MHSLRRGRFPVGPTSGYLSLQVSVSPLRHRRDVVERLGYNFWSGLRILPEFAVQELSVDHRGLLRRSRKTLPLAGQALIFPCSQRRSG